MPTIIFHERDPFKHTIFFFFLVYTYPRTLPPGPIAWETYARLHVPITSRANRSSSLRRVPHSTSRFEMVVRRNHLRDFA